MLKDYYGRIVGLPADHPMNDADVVELVDDDAYDYRDEDDLTPCEWATDRSAAYAENAWAAGRDMGASQ